MKNLLPKDGEVYYFPEFFTSSECADYFKSLQAEIDWKQEPIKIFGKEMMQPRLTSWYGDGDKPYSYSGITMYPQAWSQSLLKIKAKIEKTANVTFTSALLNLYRDQHDSVGWHRDNEKELGKNPVIGSVSFGAARMFRLKHHKEKDLQASLELQDESFLLMKGETQNCWLHSIPKMSSPVGPRINLTFRIIQFPASIA